MKDTSNDGSVFFLYMTLLQNNRLAAYGFMLLTGILLWLAWPHTGFTPLIFIAWVPLLLAEDKIKSPFGFFFMLWATFLLWNIGTTWWIWNSTAEGAIGAIVANSLIMCVPIMLYRFTRKKLNTTLSLIALAVYWTSYEWLHHNWELSWPWLTLGNVFASKPSWIQWYQFTGTTGGTIWVWVVNLLIFSLVSGKIATPKSLRIGWSMVAALLLPIFFGIFLTAPKSALDEVPVVPNQPNVVVVQPNVEPYFEKFETDPMILTNSLITLSESKIDKDTRLVVWPETAIPAQAWEHEIEMNGIFQKVFEFTRRHPQIMLVTGIDSYKAWGEENPGGFSIRQLNNGNYYEAFNTAMAVGANRPFSLYHKSKLVPGVESLPSWLGFMSSVFDDFGGIAGSLGTSEEAIAFDAPDNPYTAAPIICYESIYSDYVTSYVRKGANILTIITNDGWWGNTAGHHQHLQYARLRAIETGLWVARSANTGISCFIDPHGHIYQAQPWEKQAAIKMSIPTNTHSTLYTRTGDWLSKLAAILAIMLFIFALISKKKIPLN